MSDMRDFRRRIEDISASAPARELMFTAKVISATDTHCSVEVAGMTLSQVKLYSIAAGGTYLVKPKAGTMVTVIDMSRGSKRDLCVVKVDEPACVKISSNGFVVDFDCETQKFDIKNNGASLKEFFETLIDIIKTLQVTVPGIGLSLVPFQTSQKLLEALKTKLDQLFK